MSPRHPSLLRGTQLVFQTDFTSQGGTPLYDCSEWISIEWQEALSGKGRGYARVVLPKDAEAVNHARMMNVLRINQQRLQASGGFDTYEFRITELDDSTGPELVVTAQPFITEFGRTQIRNVSGGVPTKKVPIVQLSPRQVITEVVIPAMTAEGYTGIGLGTILATGRLSADLDKVTPLAVLEWLEQQTGYEAYVTRVSESAWSLNLASQGDGVLPPVVVVGRNVISLDRAIVADDQFTTRVEPEGTPRPTDVAPSHIGQALWDAVQISPGVIAVSDPAGGPGPIGAVDQMVGKTAIIPLDPVAWPQGGPALGRIAVDSTRHIVWMATNGTDTLQWTNLITGDVGSLTVSSATFSEIAYAYGLDRVYAVNGNSIVVINAATKAVMTTVSLSATPSRLDYVPTQSTMFVMYAPGSSGDFQVLDLFTNTITGTIASTATISMAYFHPGSNRIFTFQQGSTNVGMYNASTGALISNITLTEGVMQISVPSATFPNLLVVSAGGNYAWINMTTFAVTAFTSLGLPESPTIVYGRAPTSGMYINIVASGRVFPFDGTAWSGVYGDLPNTVSGSYVSEGFWDAATYLLSLDTTLHLVRRLRLGRGNPLPFELATVMACDMDLQTVTLATAPLYLAVDSRLQFREDAYMAYLTRLTDPDAVATYGNIDASPSFTIIGLTNYWRGGRLSDWRADGTLRGLSMNGVNVGEDRSHRWHAADYVGGNAIPFTSAATYTAGDLTITVTGLPVGRVLMPGDRICNSATLVANPQAFVRYRTVVDITGSAVVPVTPGSLGTMASGTALYLFTPQFTLGLDRPDGAILMPTVPMSGWPTATTAVPVPHILGDTVAWVVAHLQLWCVRMVPNSVFLRVSPPFGATPVTIRPADTVTVSTGEVRDYWLAQRVDLATAISAGSIGVEIGANPGGGGTASTGAILIRSLAVILSPGSTAEGTAIDIYGAEGSNALWQLGNVRLAQGKDPSVNYKVEALEDEDSYLLGVKLMMIDPVRAISKKPRIISVTRYGSGPDELLRKPVIEVSSASFSLLRAIVALQQQANITS